jgi:repressor LexA
MSLTQRQQAILDFVNEHCATHGYPPTVREIGSAVGLASSSTVHAHLANLERLGHLRRDPTKPRALELLGEAARKITGPSGLPVVGRVAAGSPAADARGRSRGTGA